MIERNVRRAIAVTFGLAALGSVVVGAPRVNPGALSLVPWLSVTATLFFVALLFWDGES